jgi:hypothetical protein
VTWHVMAVASGEVLPDEVRWVKFNTPSWTKDSKGL